MSVTGQQTCVLGERILDAFLRQKGWIPYRPEPGIAHPFDRLIASADKKRICVVEVKTKCRREAYADTGINQRHFDDYQHITSTYNLPLFLAFVDAKVGRVYGNWWSALIQRREPDPTNLDLWRDGLTYPLIQGGIVYFPLDAMRTLAVLSEEERNELLSLRRSSWRPTE